MKPAAVPDIAGVPAAPPPPNDEAQKRAIAKAVWTDLLWLMPIGRTVTITGVVKRGKLTPYWG